ncbi:MAG: Deoxyuridine 5'-triphosphate nucleotidohydrolase [Calditrichaeota bacterium]|nr:Deoxyuridine 5'-triphosphate nucleotidohydrolase [Calditrichota bacterium]
MTKRELTIPIMRLDEEATADVPLPAAMSPGSAGLDVHAAVERELVIEPRETVNVPTGFAIAVPDGYEAQVRPRSGLAMRHSITMPNAPGTIDSDYRGEVKVLLTNLGTEPFAVRRGDRIAQLVVAPVVRVDWKLLDRLPESRRGAGGFGSTGR